ncbi:ParB N-terminal domain-containing protein [Clostridium sp.]|uniref:ParB/RepB/Spo0J family partition protein n=1 Tax=Clostridium sp. TaxID=1506 RepID=UPI001B42FD4D|nr:ParB N-terminal domain-containing protein [Clostridium sp.]MBP3914460.1 ParB N-terminal domain-containing protein [Clostridium sp.]
MSSKLRKELEKKKQEERLAAKNKATENNIIDFTNKDINITGENLPKILANINAQIIDIPIELLIPAKKEWNFFSKLSEDQKNDLKMSILKNGLLHPLIVWEQPDGKYMILSGHNRYDIFSEIYEEQKNNHPEVAKSYTKILAKVFSYDSLDEAKAEEIVIDTNYLNRKLSPMEIQKCIYRKYKNLGRKSKFDKSPVTRTTDIIAEEYGLKSRMVANYIKLGDLIEDFEKYVDNKEITIRTAIKIAGLKEDVQRYLYDNYLEKLLDKKNKSSNKIKANMITSEIDVIFCEESKEKSVKTKSITIPVDIYDEYKEVMIEFIKKHKLFPNKNIEEIYSKL